ncbi:MAG: GNAT family N-acetyltransferase [Planctomycetota bacterium]
MSDLGPDFEVRVAREVERRQALELALRPLAPASRAPLLDNIAAGENHVLGPLDALIVATRGRVVSAAAWGQPSPGKAVALWPPEWDGARPPNATPVEAAILRSINTRCDAVGVPMTQVLFEVGDDPRIPTVVESGFEQIAELDYLGRSIGNASAREAVDEGASPLTFVEYLPSHRERLKRLVEQTYVESLDCPGLEELRDLDDVLAGYLATGQHKPEHWFFVQAKGEDIGVLLLAEHPDSDQAELVYMGITPAARGNNYGAQIVDHAITVAEAMGVDHLMVAVDRANGPARNVYDLASFAAWARRYVYVRRLGGIAVTH